MALLELNLGSQRLDTWTSVSVTRSLESMADGFFLSMAGLVRGANPPVRLFKGTSCTLAYAGELVLTGYVGRVAYRDDARSIFVDVSGRSCTGDLVDCSAVHPGGQWHQASLLHIARDICRPFGISVETNLNEDGVHMPFPRFAVDDGERAIDTLERAAKQRGILMTSTPEGHLLLTRAGNVASGVTLVRGEHVLGGSFEQEETEQFSEYTVKGQMAGHNAWHGSKAASPVGRAFDAGVLRYRPLVITSDTQGDSAALEKRAQWERNVRMGRSLRWTYELAGWTKPGPHGGLWRENETVVIDDAWYGVNRTLLITAVTYRLDAHTGCQTSLELALPEAWEVLSPQGPTVSLQGGF